MKSKPFLKLNLNLLHRPDHKWLCEGRTCEKLGLYVIILMYLANTDRGVASFHSFRELSAASHKSLAVVRRFVEESGLFHIDPARQLYQSIYMCEEMGFKRCVGVPVEWPPSAHEVDTKSSPSRPIYKVRAREDEDEEEDEKEKEKKEDGMAASFGELLESREREPEGVAELFADEALLSQVAARVNYLICSPRNRPLVRRWLADYIRRRGYYRAHPLCKQTAALKLYELLRPGTETRRQFWEYMNRSLA